MEYLLLIVYKDGDIILKRFDNKETLDIVFGAHLDLPDILSVARYEQGFILMDNQEHYHLIERKIL